MVLDPLTALSITSNAAQLAEFTGGLISRGRKIYKSVDGALDQNLELETITNGLIKTNNLLASSLRSEELRGPLSDRDEDLRAICRGCESVGTELIHALQKLKIQGKHGKWKSFRQALKSMLSKDEIDDLTQRLESFRKQLDTHILISLRVDANAATSDYSKQVDPTDKVDLSTSKVLRRDLRLSNDSWCQENLLEAESTIDAGYLTCLLPRLTDVVGKETSPYETRRFLDLLRYPDMPERYERITEAYRQTCDCIYRDSEVPNESCSSFVNWLERGTGSYWITGKAGSGKSTLMRYLCDDPRTREGLRPWVGQMSLVIAGFFFWNSGSRMQMSQIGLLQTLLYEALSQHPSLIPLVFPRRWHLHTNSRIQFCAWTMSELLQGFEILIKQNGSIRFCFFVDGLDECGDDHSGLLDLLKDLASCPNVKFCLSSRPWLLFEDAFEDSPRLMLQDFTYQDMKHYVTTRLCQSTRYLVLEQGDAVCTADLVREITDKASGLWLWVHLVVKSLLSGITNSDKPSDLRKRLQLIPADLEDLYGRMFDDIDLFYLKNASQLFQIVRAARNPPSLLGLSFADEEDPVFALQAEMKSLTGEEQLSRCQAMKRRLNSRCKGLLEVPSPDFDPDGSLLTHEKPESRSPDYHIRMSDRNRMYYQFEKVSIRCQADLKIEYLHRTVKDFIARPEIWNRLVAATNKSYDPNLALGRSYMLQLKTYEPNLVTRERLWELIAEYMYHAVLTKHFDKTTQTSMFDELDRVASNLAMTPKFVASSIGRAFYAHSDVHWTSTGPQGKHGNNLTAFAIQYDFSLFIEARLSESGFDFNDQKGRPLLYYATIDWERSSTFEACRKYDDGRVVQNLRIIKSLLERGANPNYVFASSTPWLSVLARVGELLGQFSGHGSHARSIRRWADITEQFIQYGADLKIKLGGHDVTSIIRETFSQWDSSRTKDLERMVRQGKRRWTRFR